MKFVIYPSLFLPYCSTIYSFAFPLCYLLRKTPCICSRAPHFKYDCTLKCEIALNINIEPTCVSDLILLHVSQTIHKLTGQAHPTPSTSWGFGWEGHLLCFIVWHCHLWLLIEVASTDAIPSVY